MAGFVGCRSILARIVDESSHTPCVCRYKRWWTCKRVQLVAALVVLGIAQVFEILGNVSAPA